MEFPQQDEGEEDGDEQDYRHGDPHQDGLQDRGQHSWVDCGVADRVVRVRADGLGPGRLAELVPRGVGPHLHTARQSSLTADCRNSW